MTTEHLCHLFSRFWADTDGWKEIDYSVRQFFFIFACTNSCVNPLIYGAFTDRNTGLFVSKERLCFMPRARKRRWRVSNWIGKDVSVWTLCISHWEIWHFVSSWDLPAKNWISTGKFLSEALIFVPTNPQYDDRLFIELWVQYKQITSSVHVVYPNCFFNIQNTLGTPGLCIIRFLGLGKINVKWN